MQNILKFIKNYLIKLIRFFFRLIKYQYSYLQNLNQLAPDFIQWNWSKIYYDRIAFVNLLVNKSENSSNLEIVCDTNSLFDSIPAKNKIGIDLVSGGTARMTSDEFFKNNKLKFDVIFIDGLHTYEQVRRDSPII